jgi:uncharacterized protein YcbK (DUF882 family)
MVVEKSYFSREELTCTCCDAYGFDDEALLEFNIMRAECGFPFVVTSAYRCEDHPIEAKKIEQGKPFGAHTRGTAMDIYFDSDAKLMKILQVALDRGVRRIGIHDKAKFIHLDFDDELPSPSYWQY